LLSAALLELWPQVCRVKITRTKLPTNRFVSTTQISDEKRCKLDDSTKNPVRSRNAQLHLESQALE
jgi:hypothetical protein